MSKRRVWERTGFALLLAGILLAGGCGMHSVNPDDAAENMPADSEIRIVIPGLEEEYRFAAVSDVHIVAQEQSASEYETEIQERYELFRNAKGESTEETWNHLAERINEYDPAGVWMVGDMVDFFSDENIRCLKKGIDIIKAPVLYVRADHDYGTWYQDTDPDYMKKAEDSLADDSPVITMEYPEFIVVGVNNNTSQLSKKALKKLKKIWKKEKPVILVLHVPLASRMENGLAEESKRLWGDRALLWGKGCSYEPNDRTAEFLDMVYDEDSPVAAVISAHLHFPYKTKLNEKITEYVLDASFKDVLAIVTVAGK